MVSTFVASILLFLAAFFCSLIFIMEEALENNGMGWSEVLLLSEVGTLFFVTIWWIMNFSYNYYNNGYIYDNNNYFNYLFSIFPKISQSNMKIWILLCLRGITGTTVAMFYIIALIYINAGNATLFYNVFVIFGNLFVGIIFFNEKLNFTLFFSFLICIIGIILVCQPSFIFNNTNDSDQISLIGIFFVFCASSGRVTNATIVKHSSKLNVNYIALCIIPEIITTILSAMIWILYNISSNNSILSFNIGYHNTIILKYEIAFFSVAIGFLTCLWMIVFTIGYQSGDLGRLAVIGNADIVITYILDAWLLNDTTNWIAYCGAIILCIACFIVFLEQYKNNNSRDDDSNNISNDIDDSDQGPTISNINFEPLA